MLLVKTKQFSKLTKLKLGKTISEKFSFSETGKTAKTSQNCQNQSETGGTNPKLVELFKTGKINQKFSMKNSLLKLSIRILY